MHTKLVLAICLAACVARAREPRFYQRGTLVEMNAVQCGYEEKGAKGVSGMLLGTDAQHSKTQEMLCQEYVLRSDRIVYRVRPKDDKHPRLLPIGEQADFRIAKDRMYLRVSEMDDKERQFFVTSMTPRTDVNTSKTAASASGQSK